MHYILYALAQRALAGQELELGMRKTRIDRGGFILAPGELTTAMFGHPAPGDAAGTITHSLLGLVRENLVEDQQYVTGEPSAVVRWYREAGATNDDGAASLLRKGGFVYTISVAGIDLFCAAHGMRRDSDFLDPASHFVLANAPNLGRLTAQPLSVFRMDGRGGPDLAPVRLQAPTKGS